MTIELVLAGRAELAERVRAWLGDSSATSLALQAESSHEALAVFAAVVLQLTEEERLRFLSRIVVVDSVAAWNSLSLSDEPLILVPRFRDERAIGRAGRKGHRVIVPLSSGDSGSAELIPRLARGQAEEALRSAGLPEDKVESLVTLARRSMTCFRRKLAVRPEVQQPRWAQATEARALLPSLLAGAWNDRSEGDRQTLAVLAKLAGLRPAGKVADHPNETLRRIFLPWFPQTHATVEERLRVLDALREREPQVAWELLLHLLPENHSIGHPTHKAQWREWLPDAEPGVTHREYFTVTTEVLERMLNDVGENGAQWENLIDIAEIN